MLKEPLKPADAKGRIRSILSEGETRFSRHAIEEMAEDDLEPLDCVNVLRGGVVQAGEMNLKDGSWRYRVQTRSVTVVVAFRSERELVIVTAWRNTRRR